MFYCKPCAIEHGLPQDKNLLFRSTGLTNICHLCQSRAECYNLSLSELPANRASYFINIQKRPR